MADHNHKGSLARAGDIVDEISTGMPQQPIQSAEDWVDERLEELRGELTGADTAATDEIDELEAKVDELQSEVERLERELPDPRERERWDR